MLAGFDTTATTLSWIIFDLATNTDCQDKLVEEIDAQIGDVNISQNYFCFNIKQRLKCR